MSANSSLSAAKRRRGGSQSVQTPESGKKSNVQQGNPTPKIPHPLDILKDHELRIRSLETIIKELTQKLTIAETDNTSFNTKLVSLNAENENILNQLQLIKSKLDESKLDESKLEEKDPVTNLEPTFNKLDIEGTISEEHSDSDISDD